MRKLSKKGDAPAWLTGKVSAANKRVAAQIASGQSPIRFNSGLYGDERVRSALNNSHFGKCAYCELRIEPAATAQVEHFRPKGEVLNEDTTVTITPGYYYLAYSWDNLLLACPKCNSAAYKGNRFPLRDETQRATKKAELSAERPLLLNPFLENPRDRIRFRKGVAYPLRDDIVGKTTIDVLGLNREGLVDARREHLVYLRALASSAVNDPDPNERLIFTAKLKLMLSPYGQYASCVADDFV